MAKIPEKKEKPTKKAETVLIKAYACECAKLPIFLSESFAWEIVKNTACISSCVMPIPNCCYALLPPAKV